MAKILVVEDMDSVVDLLRTLLEREGFEVAVAQDGLEALEAVRREKPDLMLLDLILPGLDGLEVLRRVRQDPITAHLPVIVLSGKDEERDKVIGLEIGADDYVTKPFQANELIARVKNRL
ncbi:MAG TPA: response regulator, partial [Nitrospira sp.]|nr:response regulator [Nitrospira sp.]